MTNWGYDNGDGTQTGNENEIDGPKALRDAYKALKDQNEQLNLKLTSFLEDQQKSKVSAVFDSLGIPEAAKVYQGPADPDKAKEWAESMKAVFGTGSQGPDPTVADSTPAAEPTLPPSMQAQFQRMSEAGQQGQPIGNFEAAQAAVNNADSLEALIAAHKSGLHGG